ncbi:DUF7472 family protein [Halopelagius longus]|uniref:Uncharacterized protein n=1 Tax=Halopelagius longus TaxID=1236180 RepID=A0A1H1EC41_9EURY|nr:hypothetical protein [Halopelagius longus]RDI71694.1 hypothetical protein DWB78_08120 [Halopelagius longus]SDQ86322.1 hypothetical protein SAMN05216278_2835 [Halopelagius longus]
MEIEAEMRRKIVASVVAVGFFIALIIGLGVTFGDGATGTGGLALVGAISLFIVAMGALGLWLDG